MRNALALFESNIIASKGASAVHTYLSRNVVGPVDYSDLLRAQVVYCVSAFDKLMHDLVRRGMIETFTGVRPATVKYLNETVSIDLHIKLGAATVPPAEVIFEQALFAKFKAFSFQEPAKVADALSYIWNEPHKWQRIAAAMGISESAARTELKLIVDRRNEIVHEADIDPLAGTKRLFTETECTRATDFIERCGSSIANLVI
jgi:hypothetical protein